MADRVFARRLSALRKAAGLTQQQLAGNMAETGSAMHRSAIAKIEAGDRAVSIGEAVQLARALGVGLAELVTDPDSGSAQERAHRARVDAQVKVRGLQYEAASRYRLLKEQVMLYENTVTRLREAGRRLAELGGEMPPEPPAIEQTLAAASRPLAPGEDDR